MFLIKASKRSDETRGASTTAFSITRSFINAIIYVCYVSLNIISRADNYKTGLP